MECFWRQEPWRLLTPALGVLPDGRVDVIWSGDGKVVVIGPQTRALGRPVPPEFAVVGVRFSPGVGAPLLGLPARELADMHVALDEIDSRAAASLLRELDAIESVARAPAATARAVAEASRLASGRQPAGAARNRAARRSDDADRARRRRPAQAAADAGYSDQSHLTRETREFSGLSPRRLGLVLRRLSHKGALGAFKTGHQRRASRRRAERREDHGARS